VRQPNAQRASIIGGRRVQSKRPCWELRVAGIENVTAFAQAIPMWGPRGRVLVSELAKLDGRHRGSQHNYLPAVVSPAVFTHLADRGVSPQQAATLIGERAGNPRGGMPTVLGAGRIRRDRLATLADALDDPFLQELLAEELSYSAIRAVLPVRQVPTYDVEVDEFHNLVAEDVVVHNCAPPFKQAEFDILWGHGISREGSLIDLGVDHGIVRKAGAWYTYDADQLGQGKENSRAFLCDNPDLANEIEKKIKEKLGIGPQVDAPADGAAGEVSVDPDAPIDLTTDVVPTPVEF
jgi:recombination protein RecA